MIAECRGVRRRVVCWLQTRPRRDRSQCETGAAAPLTEPTFDRSLTIRGCAAGSHAAALLRKDFTSTVSLLKRANGADAALLIVAASSRRIGGCSRLEPGAGGAGRGP